jgi:CDP-glucose 4,6-dehydratase
MGAWLARALVERGAAVTGLVRHASSDSELFRSGTASRLRVVQGDVRDRALLERALAENEIQTVFHLAAQAIVGIAYAEPTKTFASNVEGTWTLLEACRLRAGVEQIVVASSDKAYGVHDVLPYTEDAPLKGRHPYEASKACADLIAQSYAATYRMPVCITRLGNLYGGGDLNWNRLVPGTIRSALRGERPVMRSDGTYVRDYFYVEDGALAYLTLAEQLAKKPELAGEAFNFSNELRITAREMALGILRAVGREDLELDVRATAANEIPHQYLSAAKARRLLCWQPRFTLEEGLRRTVEWYRSHLQSCSGAAS